MRKYVNKNHSHSYDLYTGQCLYCDDINPNAVWPKGRALSESILDEAKELMATDRGRDYGDFRENHEHIAALWSAYLRIPIRADQAAIMQSLVKIARTRTSPAKRDNYTDSTAYIAGAGRVALEYADEGNQE